MLCRTIPSRGNVTSTIVDETFCQKKKPYAKLDDIRQKESSSEGGTSSISHADNAAPAISLQSRDDDKSNESKALQTAASKPHGGIALYRSILANVLGKSQNRFDGGAQTEHRPADVSVTTSQE